MGYDFDQIRRSNPLPDVVARAGIATKRNGDEYLCLCPFHPDKNASLTLFQGKTGWRYMCFPCGSQGDTIDFVREYYAYSSIGEAARWLIGEDLDRKPLPKVTYAEAKDPYAGYTITRPPPDAPEIIAGRRTPPLRNPKRRRDTHYTPNMVFPYRDADGSLLGYVLRVDIEGKKLTPGIWWMTGPDGFEGWAHGSYPEPRPLYGLDRLTDRPNDQVLLVEGEKCADAAARVMEGKPIVAASWMGGTPAVGAVDWTPLKGRSVLIWPDSDLAGRTAVTGSVKPSGRWDEGILDHLFRVGASRVKLVKTDPDRGKGWDIADAEEEMGAYGIMEWLKPRIVEWSREEFERWKEKKRNGQSSRQNHGHVDPAPAVDIDRSDHGNMRSLSAAAAGGRARDAEVDIQDSKPASNGHRTPLAPYSEVNWRDALIMNDEGGIKATSSQNLMLILQYEERFKGVFAWNSFANEVYIMRQPDWDAHLPEWSRRKIKETDVTACTGFLEYAGIKPGFSDVGRTIVRVAEHNKYNPVREALDALVWDGIPRISGGMTDQGDSVQPWLSEYLGADNTEVNRLFGEKWLIGAVARAMEPGCKMDTMLVLEGPQGLQKSTALRALSDGLVPGVFTDEMSDPNSKDAGLQMQGAFIVEIAELDAFRRAEITQIKSWLARGTDRFRRPYGKVVEEFPRSCVFAGTVNPLGNTGYLKDPTGARRFWPVLAADIDIAAIKRDAPQLWAEAVVMYRAKKTWWLTKEQEALAIKAQKSRYEEDPYGELIDDFVRTETTPRLQAIMGALEITKERRNPLAARRVISHMARKGWRRVMIDGRVAFEMPEGERLV